MSFLFDPQVEQAIQECLDLETNLEIETLNKNPQEYINNLLPDPSSTKELDQVINKLKAKVMSLENELIGKIQSQTQAGIKNKDILQETKTSMNQFFGKIHEIKTKAEQNELVVQQICKDIKRMDIAKINVKKTVDSLQDLYELTTLIKKLPIIAQKKDYEEESRIIFQIQKLFEKFQKSRKRTKIKELTKKFEDAKGRISEQITSDFRLNIEIGVTTPNIGSQLLKSCLVVDAIGETFRKELSQWFCQTRLQEYNTLFQPLTEGGSLESVDRRYIWFKKILKNYEANYSQMFPTYWLMEQVLSEEFCYLTRQHLDKLVMNEQQQAARPNVQLLLESLQVTVVFENFLVDLFHQEKTQFENDQDLMQQNDLENNAKDHEEDLKEISIQEKERLENEEQNQNENSNENLNEIYTPTTAEQIREKYRKFRMEKEKEEEIERKKQREKELEELEKQAQMNPQLMGKLLQPKIPYFKGLISQIFEQCMGLYLENEDENLTSFVQKILSEETWDSESKLSTKVLKSAYDLFLFFKKSSQRFSDLTTGQPIVNLYKLYKQHLENYCREINKPIPLINEKKTFTVPNPNKTTDGQVFLTDEKIKLAGLIINTLEYCITTVIRMSENIKRKLGKIFEMQINNSDIQNVIVDQINSLVFILVSAIETRTDSSFQEMIRTQWNAIEDVGDQSPYISQFVSVINDSCSIIANVLTSTKQYQFFCNKFAQSFVTRFNNAVLHCKKISDLGAQQLLLDTQSLKSVLLQLPSLQILKNGSKVPPLRAYVSYIKKQMGKTELLIKVIISSQINLVDNYIKLIHDHSLEELEKVMEIMGVSKNIQKQNIEIYKQMTGEKPSVSRKK
ncbi:vacuolar protein sorting-associated protein [Anaeramoeba ignava]|uniref:Vacuolar protein sorting-associated protein n=1 Tax=Anaeramoeba ignava TaxID=1746090 RepID=A0A9Q0R908_ANAIG|nr:vacuolar protein sorting-associated protein [Anaeramoeba ignava]